MSATGILDLPGVSGGLIEDLEREDDARGPEPDEGEFTTRVVITTGSTRRSLEPYGNSGLQCDQCGGWFSVTFWTCQACAATTLHRAITT